MESNQGNSSPATGTAGNRSVTVLASFLCRAESFDRAEFQKAGRFVAGHVTGPTIHALTFCHPITGGQILRVQGNSPDECVGLMGDALQRELVTLWAANYTVGFNYKQFIDLNERMNALSMFLRDNYSYEAGRGDHTGLTAETIAIRYLRRERRRWGVRIAQLFRRAKSADQLPSDSDLMLPEEMRRPK